MSSRLCKLLFAALLSLTCVHAQDVHVQAVEAKPLPRHPGDVIKYKIVFDGPNAEKIKTVFTWMTTNLAAPKDQVGFVNQFNVPGPVSESSSKTFTVEMKIPDNAATGEYRLFFEAKADEGVARYTDGQEFDIPPIHVENPRQFTPPAIKVNPLP
jgi:hypothetical protein